MLPGLTVSPDSFVQDARLSREERVREREAFALIRRAENDYARRLRQVARSIGVFIRTFAEQAATGETVDFIHLAELLERYSGMLEPWARVVALRFLTDVAKRDERAWDMHAKRMSRELQREIQTAPTGEALRQFLETQVKLITSLPATAARRVHDIAVGNLYSGARFTELAKIIADTGEVTQSRATLIARTETARVASTLTKVRAEHIGSEGYIWRTVRDRRVRASHRKMEGTFHRWDTPPTVDLGVPPYHAGMVWNCRCYPEPVIPDRYAVFT